MFLFEKYCPKTIDDLMFNEEVMSHLRHLATYEDIPHIIISGPAGGGKKILVKFFLEELYNADVNKLSKIKYNIHGSSTKKEIEIMQSDYHIIIEPTSTNHDKYILQEIIKQYAMHKSFNIFAAQRKFKTIVIHNIENLANNSQAALRRTMELYAKTCRFIMICNNLSKIFAPLRSRCRIFCVPLPKISDITNIITYITLVENITITRDDMEFIIKNCNNSLKKAIWILDTIRLNSNSIITLDEVFNDLIKLILKAPTSRDIIKLFDTNIRTNVYNIMITSKGTEIIVVLLERLIKEINDDKISAKIIKYASEAEYNLVHGRRDITHIDNFILGVIKELYKRQHPVPVQRSVSLTNVKKRVVKRSRSLTR